MSAPNRPALRWDIFCRVIDNFGDLGICWRLAYNLVQRGQRVRLWVDDPSALRWMAPEGDSRIEVKAWTQPLSLTGVTPGEVLVEAFGCTVDPDFLKLYASFAQDQERACLWLNVEYLSAETYVERSHGLRSPVGDGPGAGLNKYFYYPGFTQRTGGLLREPDLLERQRRFDRAAWLAQHVPSWQPGERLISLFCYEPAALPSLLRRLAQQDADTRLLITTGRAGAAVQASTQMLDETQTGWNAQTRLRLSFLPALSQTEFDHLLWACDFNCVRGEDSLVRALWAAKPMVWNLYPQTDDAHGQKLAAFLDWLQASADLRQFHRTWNGLDNAPLGPIEFAAWGETVQRARSNLLEQTDLAAQLLEFVYARLDSRAIHLKKH